MTVENHATVITDNVISYKLQHQWESILNTPIIIDNTKLTTVNEGISNSYTGNFYGLLSNELKIPQVYWYINMRVNGYECTLDYDGASTFYIIDPSVLEDCLNIIRNQL